MSKWFKTEWESTGDILNINTKHIVAINETRREVCLDTKIEIGDEEADTLIVSEETLKDLYKLLEGCEKCKSKEETIAQKDKIIHDLGVEISLMPGGPEFIIAKSNFDDKMSKND